MHKFLAVFQLAALAFFLVVFIGRSLYLWLAQGINPLALGSGKKGLPRLLELLLLPWLALWMLAVVLAAWPGVSPGVASLWAPAWPAGLVAPELLGVLGILAGEALFVWALASFGASWRIGIDEKKAGALVTGGVFAFSRNPVFAFIDLYFLGTFLVNGGLVFLVFALVTVIALHYQVLQEEAFLASRYGQPYREYCQRTRRYFGRRSV
ncbi:MAG: isoprenylcysteine carboxylmethyltransferase family protein [Anaerolineales bacterium]